MYLFLNHKKKFIKYANKQLSQPNTELTTNVYYVTNIVNIILSIRHTIPILSDIPLPDDRYLPDDRQVAKVDAEYVHFCRFQLQH
ncbi:hypothetical protein SDC9_105149 [bioreactor metagenome]|uniref:Uncharacterized protein n=1 Tax=bioreactor metagenome TaxID=1076179 RepID=A0A645AZV1_9ZZZZ